MSTIVRETATIVVVAGTTIFIGSVLGWTAAVVAVLAFAFGRTVGWIGQLEAETRLHLEIARLNLELARRNLDEARRSLP